MENKHPQQGGIGFLECLALLFIALKLCHVITWSWLWVLCPLWAGGALLAIVIALSTAIHAVRDAGDALQKRNTDVWEHDHHKI